MPVAVHGQEAEWLSAEQVLFEAVDAVREAVRPKVVSAMSAYQIGPLVLSAPRFYAALGLAVLVLLAEVVTRRRRRARQLVESGEGSGAAPSAAWAWNAALAVFIGSFAFSIVFMALKLFLGALQAYIFTVLTAQYVSTSISEAH